MPYGRCALADSPCWWRAVTTGSQVGGLSQNHQGKSIAGALGMGRKLPPHKTFCLEIETFQVSAEGIGEIRPPERDLHRGLEEAELFSGVVPASLELDGIDRPAAAKRAEAVGELDLPAGVGQRLGEDRKEIRGEEVASDDSEVGRRVLGIGLLDEVQHFENIPSEPARPDDAVAANLFLGDAHDGEHGAVVTLEDVEELPHAWHARDDDVVAQEDAEGLVAHEGPRTENGVAEPERLLLPDIGHGGELGDGPDLRQLLRLASIL